MFHCIRWVVLCCSRKPFLTDAFVVLWQAVNCKGQHSISYTLSRNQTVVVEYSHDKDTDMFQVLSWKNKKTLWNIFSFVPLCINSVSACWLRVGKSLSLQCVWPPPQLIKICDMGHNYISSLRHVLRYRVAYVCLFLRSGLRTRDLVIQLVANEKKSKNRNQQQGQNRNSLYKKEIKWDRCIFISVEVFI